MAMTERRRVGRIVRTQGLLTAMLAIVALPFGVSSARDVLCGGIAAVLGSVVFAYFTFGCYQAARPDAIVRQLYLGQLVRFSVIAGIFLVVALVLSNLNPVALLAAFFIVQILPLIAVNLYDRNMSSGQRK